MQYTYQSATIDKSSQSSDTLSAYATPDQHSGTPESDPSENKGSLLI